jgi:hypothetical protein
LFLVEITIVRLEKNVALKKTMKEEALKETVPFYLSRLDALVQKNNGFLALGRVRIFQNLDKGFES